MTTTRIILVRTHYPGNIGSVARVMTNFGLSDLVLVDPIADPKSHEARMLAAGGVEVLDSLRVMSFDEAVADCTLVYATAGDIQGTLRSTIAGTPHDLMPRLIATPGTRAIVFGPEPHGLTTVELGRAHALLTLPADPAYSSFNLSMAVGITLYDWFNASLETAPSVQREPAAFEPVDRALAHLEESLHAVSFLFGQNAQQLMHGFRHMILRAQPTAHEVGMLHGLARQFLYIAAKWKDSETESDASG